MFGILFFGILGIGAFVYSCKNDADNARRRENSRQNGQDYYMDNIGKDRRVDNNHQVVRVFKNCNGSDRADDVLMDLKTGQVLHNYSEDKRRIEREEINKAINENISRREKARKKGEYAYRAYDEHPIIDGFYEDMHAAMYLRNPYNLSERERNGADHVRRVSDNLLLTKKTLEYGYGNHVYRDGRCELVLYCPRAEERDDKETIYKLAQLNWKTIKEWDTESFYRTMWHECSNPEPFPTSAEVEAYARKIGAYLDTGE